MPPDLEGLDPAALKAMICLQHAELLSHRSQIERLELLIAKLRRMQFGRSSEKVERQIEQLELKLEELEANHAELAPEPTPQTAAADRKSPRKRRVLPGMAGPGLLAHVLTAKFCDHLPLYRQSAIYAREGVELDRSTLARWVGESSSLLAPLVEALRRHVMSASKQAPRG